MTSSSGEISTPAAAGLWRVKLINDSEFDEFDKHHYEVENKLVALIESLEVKRGTGRWLESLPHSRTTSTLRHPQIINPLIH